MAHGVRGEFGALLKQARELKGVTLQQVAATTKISARFLEALEKNDESKLPGGIFSRSFVRAYAREVGLDPEDTVRRFVEAFPPESEDAEPAAASRAIDAETYESGRRAVKTLLLVIGLSIVVLLAGLVYWKLRPSPAAVPPPVTGTPASRPAPAQVLPATPGAAEVALTTPAPAAAPQAPATASAAPTAVIPPAPQAQPEGSTGAVEGPEVAPLAVSVFASEACWLSLSVDGRKVIGRNLEPGERVQFRARAAIDLVAGNAGALTVTINGKPARQLGERGEVVTTAITVDNYKSLLL